MPRCEPVCVNAMRDVGYLADKRPPWRRYRVLFDTGVLLDMVVPGRPQAKEACRVLELCNGEGDFGFACALSFKDVYYVVQRRYGEPLARQAIERLCGLVSAIPVSWEECEMSLHGDEPDFEDGLVRACAELNDIDFILTRDAAAFAHSPVRSVTCAEYLEIVGEG